MTFGLAFGQFDIGPDNLHPGWIAASTAVAAAVAALDPAAVRRRTAATEMSVGTGPFAETGEFAGQQIGSFAAAAVAGRIVVGSCS